MNANTQILNIIAAIDKLILSLVDDYPSNAKKIVELRHAKASLEEAIR